MTFTKNEQTHKHRNGYLQCVEGEEQKQLYERTLSQLWSANCRAWIKGSLFVIAVFMSLNHDTYHNHQSIFPHPEAKHCWSWNVFVRAQSHKPISTTTVKHMHLNGKDRPQLARTRICMAAACVCRCLWITLNKTSGHFHHCLIGLNSMETWIESMFVVVQASHAFCAKVMIAKLVLSCLLCKSW